jgi:hypothetical protein
MKCQRSDRDLQLLKDRLRHLTRERRLLLRVLGGGLCTSAGTPRVLSMMAPPTPLRMFRSEAPK